MLNDWKSSYLEMRTFKLYVMHLSFRRKTVSSNQKLFSLYFKKEAKIGFLILSSIFFFFENIFGLESIVCLKGEKRLMESTYEAQIKNNKLLMSEGVLTNVIL